jgi:putative hemolysin
VTEEELRHVLELGRRSGLLEPTEQKIAERALRLGERSVGDLVIPRVDLVTLDVNDPPEVVVRKVEGSEQVLFPVSDGGPDEIVGVVSLRQLFARHGSGRVDRSDLQAAVYLPETLGALDALERFRRDRLEEALVFDEHGGLEGMVTLRRFTEALVGDLPSPAEPEPLVVRRGDGSLLVDGSLATAELAAILELDPALGETLEQSRTVGGFVLAGLGRVPKEGDELDWGDWRFEVVDMDRRRVDKVLVVRPGAAEAEPPTE